MDLDFSNEQKLIKDEAVNFLKKECPFSTVKELEEDEAGYSPKMWQKMAELGWLALPFAEAYGGDGGKFMDLVLIEEALGGALCPSPFFSTVVQCGLMLLESGSEAQKKEFLPGMIDGKTIMSLAQYEGDGSYQVSDTQTLAIASGDNYTISGTKLFAIDANIADYLIVTAKTGDSEVSLFMVDSKAPGVDITKLPTIGKDNNCEVVLKDVAVAGRMMIGSPGSATDAIGKMNAKAAVAKASEMMGACKVCIDMTADYAKERQQYGKPIGGFQVIQHYLSNMLIAYDTNHEYLYRITCMIDEGEDFAIDAYALKANVNEAYKFISERSVQIHGGIGTTREGDIGLFYRKAKSNEYICGDTEFFYDKVFEEMSARSAV
jgi:alkylation response protein AidB-like acyl-CoA dehydrogenase